MICLCMFLGFKIFEFYAKFAFKSTFLVEFTFISLFVLTLIMVLYGVYSFFCDLFSLKKHRISNFLDSKEKPEYD